MANLARQFTGSEMVMAGELAPGPESNLWTNENNNVAIHYIHRTWRWKFKKTFRLLVSPLVLFRLWKVYRREKCEQIVAVHPVEFYLCIGYLVSIFTGGPFYSYFHNTYLDNRRGFRKWFAHWLQPRVFQRSKAVFVMSKGMEKIWEKQYPDTNFIPLVHTFNEKVNQPTIRPEVTEDFRIAFMGNLNRSNTEAMSRFSGVMERFPKCRLVTFSGVPDKHFAAIGLSDERIEHTRVGYDEVVECLSKFDLLFLPHGFTGGMEEIEYRTIFPTRTIPYLLSGVPIVAHSPPHAFLTEWLRETDAAEVVDTPSVDAICEAISRLMNNKVRRKELVNNAYTAVQQFRANNVANLFRQTLNDE